MKCFFNFLSVLLVYFACLQNVQATDFIQYKESELLQVKKSIQSGEASNFTQKAYAYLLNLADELIVQKEPSVVDKTFFPPSKDKHDYLSISRYWWPDPSKKDGLPWIRKDGITNPSTQTDDVDRNRLGLMTKMASVLSLAYYFSGEEKYAKKAASVLKVWFLNSDTRMNPHLEYAQSVPGNPKGRRSGILDGRLIPKSVLDAIKMIRPSNYWSEADNTQMNAWLTQYLTWLTQSDLGKAGAKQTNNHGSWYNFQVTALAYYLGNMTLVEKMFAVVKQSYSFQFNEEGAQPHELKRTRSYFYSCFNLDAMTRIAMISEKVGQSFWNYTSDEGKSLSLAINFLLPATRGEKWPYKSKGVDSSYIAPILARFSQQSHNKTYSTLLRNILSNLMTTKSNAEHSQVLLHFALSEPEFLNNLPMKK